jgi:hypothetical protein
MRMCGRVSLAKWGTSESIACKIFAMIAWTNQIGLAHLIMSGTNISKAGVKEFERRNPKCDLFVPFW